MSIVWSSDLSGQTSGATPSGFTNKVGTVVIDDTHGTGGGKCIASGTSNNGDYSLITGAPSSADHSLKFSQIVPATDMYGDRPSTNPLLRCSTDGNNAYLLQIYSNTIQVFKKVSGSGGGWQTVGASVSIGFTCATGDNLHIRAKIVGTTISATVWRNSDSEPGSATISRTDSSITAAGVPGLYHNLSGSAAYADDLSVDDLQVTYNATLSGPSSGYTSQASTAFTVTLSQTAGTDTVVTPSANGGGGTFSPATVTIAAGTTSGTFTYTPASTGTKTISCTATNSFVFTGSVSYSVTNAPATAIAFTTNPTSGINGVASTNFTVTANGALSSSVIVTPSDGGAGGTFTPSTVTLTSGSLSGSFTYTPVSDGNKTISVTNNGGLSNPSSVTYSVSTPAATALSFQTAPTSGVATVASTNFVVVTNGTLSGNVTVTPSDGGGGGTFTPSSILLGTGTLSGSFTYTPATGGAKTISITNTGVLTNPSNVTYTVTPLATALTFSSAPTSGDVGVASSTFTVTTNGALLQDCIVSLSDNGGGGSFSVTDPVITAGNTSTSFTYTALTAGTKTISITNNRSLSNPSNVSYSAVLSTETLSDGIITMDNAKVVWSPGNWDLLSVGTYGVAKKTRQATAGNAYARLKFSGSTLLSITFDTSNLGSNLYPLRVRVVVDGSTETLIDLTTAMSAVTISSSLTTATHYVEIYLVATSEYNGTRWNTGGSPVNALRINQITLSAGATLYTAPKYGNGDYGLVYGDSLTEAMVSNTSGYPTDRCRSYGLFAGMGLNCEVGVIGYGGTGWTVSGGGSMVSFPSHWNYHNSGRPRDFSTPPKWVTVMHGTNGGADATVVYNWIVAARAAFGSNTYIVLIIPPGAFGKTNILLGVSNYQAAYTSDTLVEVLDFSDRLLPSSLNAVAQNYNTSDGMHFRDFVHAQIGAIVAGFIAKKIYTISTTVGGGSSVPTFSNRFNRSLR